MEVFRLIHNNFGEQVLLAKFVGFPELENLDNAISENLENCKRIAIHCNNLLTNNTSSITVGEWLEIIKE